MSKRKRRLDKNEVEEIQEWMENSPQGKKPTIRQIARRYGVNQPSVVKSLGGWKGIRRGRPEPPERSELSKMLKKPREAKIKGYTLDIKPEDINL